MSNYKTNFINYCILKSLSQSTIKTYEIHIKFFIDYLTDIDVHKLTQQLIESYVFHVNSSSLATMTVRSYLRDVKIFLRYIDKQTNTSHAEHVILPSAKKKLVHIFSHEEIKTIYNALTCTRDRLIFALAYDCGLRRIEITRIKLEHIYSNFLKVQGKGDKERFVPLGLVTNDLLHKYLDERNSDNEYLILTRSRKKFTVDGLSNFFRKLSDRTGINLSAHQFRHNFATNYLLNQIEHGSTDLFQLQLLMGHADQEVTKYYLHVAQQLMIVKNSYSHLDSLRL